MVKDKLSDVKTVEAPGAARRAPAEDGKEKAAPPPLEKQRKQALELALSQIQKRCGMGAIMYLGSAQKAEGIAVISTGSLSLDTALGVGGVPRGRIIEVYGPETHMTEICTVTLGEHAR